MKKWMKKYGVLVAVIFAIFLVLSGRRGFFAGRPEENKEGETAAGQDISPDEGVSYGIEIPYEYKADINETNRIDAVVDAPDTVRKEGFRMASARIADVPEASVLALLEEDYHPYAGEEYDAARQYLGEDEMYLFFSKEYSEFTMFCRTADYIGTAYRYRPTEDCNKERYALDAELPDFPLADCDRRIEELFRAYGVDGGLRVVHSTLEHETMAQEALELHADGTWEKPDYTWSAADDNYHCRVWQMCNGVPVLHGYMLQTYMNILEEGCHILKLNRDRFLEMSITEVYKISYGQEWEQLLRFEEVLERYGQFTEAAEENYAIEITEIGLRVTSVDEGGGTYRMAPIWIFYGTKTYESEGVVMPFAMMIDAVTGDELWEM